MSALGLYFGPKAINIVEAKGKKISTNIRIMTSVLSAPGLEDKVPEEVKLVALFKEELRKNRIESKEVTIALSGADLIIRTFEIPILPAKELAGAVYFEAKKYIPFKIEDLISDFQVRMVQPKRSYLVMFMGIRHDTLEKYFSILSQCGIKITSIEYSAFSLLRLIELCGLKEKGIIGVVNFDSQEEEEADFTVIENGFPIFGRDMRFSSRAGEKPKVSEDKGLILEKLKTEIRISLDYYSHKFPARKVEKMFLVGNPDTRPIIESFAQKLDLQFGYVDSSKIPGVPMGFSLGFLKAYSSALSPALKTKVTINILNAWEKTRRTKELSGRPKDILFYLLSGLRLDVRVLFVAILIGISGIIFGLIQKKPLEAEVDTLLASRPAAVGGSSYDDLKARETQLNSQVMLMNGFLKNQLYFTPSLAAISRLIPEGAWLYEINFNNNNVAKPQLTLKGLAYLQDSDRELEAVQEFLKSLQKDPGISKAFKNLSIVSLDTSEYSNTKTKVTNFTISGQG